MENKKNRTVDESRERVLLVCVDDGTRKEDFDSSIEELKSLAKA